MVTLRVDDRGDHGHEEDDPRDGGGPVAHLRHRFIATFYAQVNHGFIFTWFFLISGLTIYEMKHDQFSHFASVNVILGKLDIYIMNLHKKCIICSQKMLKFSLYIHREEHCFSWKDKNREPCLNFPSAAATYCFTNRPGQLVWVGWERVRHWPGNLSGWWREGFLAAGLVEITHHIGKARKLHVALPLYQFLLSSWIQ